MSFKQKIVAFILLLIIGTVLGILGDVDFTVARPDYFWPGEVIQSVSGIFFGWTGVIASTLFPVISSTLRGVAPIKIFLWTFANFMQAFIPYLTKRIFKFDPYTFNKKTILCFIFGCVLAADILGAQVAVLSFFYTGEITSKAMYWVIFIRWAMANIPSATVFGLLLLKFFAPALKECRLYDEE